jgi:hypothetical protein
MATGAVRADIGHAEWSVMLRDLIAACKKKGGVARDIASSSHSIYRGVEVRVGHGTKNRVDVRVNGGTDIEISDTGVRCPLRKEIRDNIVVKGSSLGDGGVWLSVEAAAFGFWLEIHVPMQPPKV